MECGILPELNGRESFTVQLWMKPASWSGTVLERGNLSVSLSGTSNVTVAVGSQTVTAAALGAGVWQQLTIVNNAGQLTVLVDNVQKAQQTGAVALDDDTELVLGNGYAGVIDEVRVWDIALDDTYARFWNNTLNEFNQQLANLVAYYKMDHEEWTASLVDYKSLWAGSETNHHGVLSGATFVSASNAKLPYLQHGAYTSNERFYDRAIQREAYLLSNDIINVGIKSFSDGHLEYATPCNHATLTGGATHVANWKNKDCVQMNGGSIVATGTPLKGITNQYTIEGYVYLNSWTSNAKLFSAGSDFYIQVGPTAGHVKVHLNGADYDFDCSATFGLNQWVFVGLGTTASGLTLRCSQAYVNTETEKTATCNPTLPSSATSATPVWGAGIDGYVDNLMITQHQYTFANMQYHRNNDIQLAMPGLGVQKNSQEMQKARSLYMFKDAANPGYDLWSQDEWLRIMKSAFEGYRGYKMRITVAKHDNWETTIRDASKRARFASDLATLSAPYDGVELDLEWLYDTNNDYYAPLVEAIRNVLPAGKTLHVSCHNHAYTFLKTTAYDKCDGFTFQQYGPDKVHFPYSKFTTCYNEFVQRGFPNNKIYLSYATTASEPFNDETAVSGIGIGSVRSANLSNSYTPSDDVDTYMTSDGTYHFMSPIQAYRRAKFALDNNCQGIFYWDMGNDLPMSNKWMYARIASYGLNANVDRIVTDATPNHPAGGQTQKEEDGFDLSQIPTEKPAGLFSGTRVTSGNFNEKIVDGAFVAFMMAPSGKGGKMWLNDGNGYNTYNEAEKIDRDALFQLEAVGNNYYLRHVMTGKYVGRTDNRTGTEGNYTYTMALYASKTDGHVAKFSFDIQTAANTNVYQGNTANWYNLTDHVNTTSNCLKPGDNDGDFGGGGNGPWKLWGIYSFTASQAADVLGIPTPSARFYTIKSKAGNYFCPPEGLGNGADCVTYKNPTTPSLNIWYLKPNNGKIRLVSYASGHMYNNPKHGFVGKGADVTIERADEFGYYTMNANSKYVTDNGDGSAVTNPTNPTSPTEWAIREVKDIPFTVSAAGVASVCLPVKAEFPEELRVYVEGTLNGDVLKLTRLQGRVLNASVPAIVYGSAGDYTLTVTDADGEGAQAEHLQGTEESIKNNDTDNQHYVLAQKNGIIGFYRTTAGEVGPFRAYMNVNESQVNAFRFSFDEIETAIRAAEDDSLTDGVMYNLGGQRVQKAAGLVIVNGKKIMVK